MARNFVVAFIVLKMGVKGTEKYQPHSGMTRFYEYEND